MAWQLAKVPCPKGLTIFSLKIRFITISAPNLTIELCCVLCTVLQSIYNFTGQAVIEKYIISIGSTTNRPLLF